jgi:methyl-accepting chemotaxis protein
VVGRGLAVVAREVKTLAEQTTRALGEIRDRTAAMANIAEGLPEATQSMSTVITQIDEISRSITGSVVLMSDAVLSKDSTSDATKRIAETVDSAAARTRQVAITIGGAGDFAVCTGEDAQRIMEAVAGLNSQTAALQEEAQHFIAQVRAA